MTELMAVYSAQMSYYRTAVQSEAGVEAVDPVMSSALVEFAALAASIPYIGPLQYPLPKTLVESGVALSVGKVLKARGLSTEVIGRVIIGAFRESQRGISADQHLKDGAMQFTERYYEIQESMAAVSHQRRHEGDWVYDFITGSDTRFDWGLDFTECGILKLFRAHGMTELVPYICVLDFLISELQGTGLQRCGTLAAGADRCDFRYKQGRPVVVPAV